MNMPQPQDFDALSDLPPSGLEHPKAVDLLNDYVDHAQRLVAMELIEAEVEQLCCERYQHDKGVYARWGANPGSIRIQNEKVKIRVPRVRNTQTNKECPLETYQKLRKPTQAQQNRLSDAIYLGLSQRDYQRVGQMYADSFGLSAASVSRIFQKRSAQALSDYEDRDLSSQTYVVLMLDGVQFRGNQVVVCIGVTEDGEKHTLGFAQMETENAAAVRGLLKNLVARGFRYDAGILCVIDGAKGFQKAIQDVFGAQAKIQRCIWHKRENILKKLKKKEEQEEIKKQFNAAHNQDTYDKARQKLMALYRDLDARGEIPAANSVREGLEETLTLHKLGVATKLGPSLSSTNIVESLNSSLRAHLGKIKRWNDSDQCYRWFAMALRECETKFKKIQHADELPKLQKALLKCTNRQTLKSTSNRF